MELLHRLISLEFWTELFGRYAALGPLAPALLAALESLIPPLPLVAIVTLNVAAHGPLVGFAESWSGSCLGCALAFFLWRTLLGRAAERASRRRASLGRARRWVFGVTRPELFGILMLPFTPSAFMNFAFGVSDYGAAAYLSTLALAKLVMIGSLALLGESAVRTLEDPRFGLLCALLLAALPPLSRRARRRHRL